MLDNLREARATALADAEALLSGEATVEALDAAEARQAEIKDLDAKIESAEALEARTAVVKEARAESGVKAFGSAVIGKEEMTYDVRGDHSFARDMIAAQLRNEPEAWSRLARHQQEVDVELRDISRTDGAGGDFVPPVYLLNEYAEFSRAARVTANLATTMALPSGTDSINIPAITTGTRTGFQAADNSSTYAPTSPRDMVTATRTGRVETISGFQNASIQMIEQSPIASGLDRLIFGDLMADYALQLNSAVVGTGDGSTGSLKGFVTLGTDTTNGIPTTWTETTPSAVGAYAAINKAISQVVNNRYRDVEAIVMSASTWYWLASLADSSNRPLIVPTNGANQAFNANGTIDKAGAAAGLVGLISGVPVYVDATMTKTYGAGTNQSPILVGKFSDSYLFESGVKTRVLPDVLSANLTVRFQVYGYAALIHRFNKSVSGITGTGAIVPSGF
jgi:HK97 family phage major capsid protein